MPALDPPLRFTDRVAACGHSVDCFKPLGESSGIYKELATNLCIHYVNIFACVYKIVTKQKNTTCMIVWILISTAERFSL